MGRKLLVYQGRAVSITKEAAVKAAVKGWVLQKASVPESHSYFPVICYIYCCLFFLNQAYITDSSILRWFICFSLILGKILRALLEAVAQPSVLLPQRRWDGLCCFPTVLSQCPASRPLTFNSLIYKANVATAGIAIQGILLLSPG